MKLRNKKTGEIIELLAKPSFVKRNDDYLQSEVNTFNSLAELNEEWEDYQSRPHVIDMWEDDCICDAKFGVELEGIERAKECGLYFETKEEAEKAVEKLKAWKRLKDKGFRFNGWNGTRIGSNISYISEFYYEGCTDDMDLLFGGKE